MTMLATEERHLTLVAMNEIANVIEIGIEIETGRGGLLHGIGDIAG
jgi:hypothetical protein